jgi:hypothetical protein
LSQEKPREQSVTNPQRPNFGAQSELDPQVAHSGQAALALHGTQRPPEQTVPSVHSAPVPQRPGGSYEQQIPAAASAPTTRKSTPLVIASPALRHFRVGEGPVSIMGASKRDRVPSAVASWRRVPRNWRCSQGERGGVKTSRGGTRWRRRPRRRRSIRRARPRSQPFWVTHEASTSSRARTSGPRKSVLSEGDTPASQHSTLYRSRRGIFLDVARSGAVEAQI